MMIRTTSAWISALSITLALSGCLVVGRGHLDSFSDTDGGVRTDGQLPPVDGGALLFDDMCGSAVPRMLLTDTTRNIEIDTTAYTSRNRQSCGAETPGNDIFIGVDVVAGEYWHFHLTGVGDNRRPMLFLTQSSRCDSRSCDFVSTACEGAGDEHFAFIADADGRWYIGIDDGATGAGQYILEAYRPICGDGDDTHGEGCDDGNLIGGDGCDRRCRRELSEARTAEIEPNDNRVEANSLVLPASNELIITGGIGGPGACTYADVYAVTVPSLGDLQVDVLNPDGTACASGALTPFDLSLQNAAGDTVLSSMQDASGCAVIRSTDLAGGEYFVRVSVPSETATSAPYRMRVRILP